MTNELQKYCQKHGIVMTELAKITNVSVPQLYLINKNPKENVQIGTIDKIWVGTKLKFSDGLSAYQYLDFQCLRKKQKEEKEIKDEIIDDKIRADN